MKTKIIKLITIFIAIIGLALTPVAAFAECSADVCNNSETPDSVKAACGCSSSIGTENTFENTVIAIIKNVILILGTVAVIFIIIGGVSYMTSSGDPGKVKKAKDTILYACIGLAICALAFAIVNFAIGIIGRA